jgi:hypothetical protein
MDGNCARRQIDGTNRSWIGGGILNAMKARLRVLAAFEKLGRDPCPDKR